MFTARVLPVLLLSLTIAGVPVGVEAHAAWFHGTGTVQKHCDSHVHAEWDHAHETGLDHPACITHPPGFALRLAVGKGIKLGVAHPAQSTSTVPVAKPDLTLLTAHRSRAPPRD